MRGRVAKLRVTYGFIQGSDNQDYFFIPSCMNGEPSSFDRVRTNEIVEFEPTETAKGLRATDVKLALTDSDEEA